MQHLLTKKFRFNEEKNLKLIETRQVSFVQIIDAIMDGKVLAFKQHHNQKDYPNQNVIFVHINEKVYYVPCVYESNNSMFLKTAYPSSKARDLFFPDYKKNNKS